jgi:hypothetical protein
LVFANLSRLILVKEGKKYEFCLFKDNFFKQLSVKQGSGKMKDILKQTNKNFGSN